MKIYGAKNIAESVGMSPGAFRMMVSRDRSNAPVNWELTNKNCYMMVAEYEDIKRYVENRGVRNGSKRP